LMVLMPINDQSTNLLQYLSLLVNVNIIDDIKQLLLDGYQYSYQFFDVIKSHLELLMGIY